MNDETKEEVAETQAEQETSSISKREWIYLIMQFCVRFLAPFAIVTMVLALVYGAEVFGYRAGQQTAQPSVAAQTNTPIEQDSATPTTSPESNEENSSLDTADTAPATDEHTHTWVPQYRLNHTDEQTHTETVAATYKDEYVNETICNTCGKVVTGNTALHTGETGHKEFTADVPTLETFVDVPEHEITVVDEPAKDIYVLDGYKCESCNKLISISEAQELGVYKSGDDTKKG